MSRVALPRSLDALWPLLTEPGAVLLAGGTDLLPRLRREGGNPPLLVGLERIPELRGLSEDAQGLRLGAATPLNELLDAPLLQSRAPVLVQALRVLGSPLVRNAATLGGNLCTASPAGDSLPPLFVLDALVELRCASGARSLPVRDFVLGPGQTALRPGEVLAAVLIPHPWSAEGGRELQHFEKLGLRASLAVAVASLAARLELDAEGVVLRARLAWGSVCPGILVCPGAEAALEGAPLGRESLERAGALAMAAARPMDDPRASAAYRRELVGRLLLRLAL